MNIESLTLKNRLTIEKTGEQYFDLSAPSFQYKRELGAKAIHYVTIDQAGRIDKISEQYFGTGAYVDAICIINNIFNPFTVEEGDVLAIPRLDDINLVYKRQSVQDQSRVQRLIQKAKTKKNGVKAPIPPNMLQQGQDAKVYKGGRIILGANLPTKKKTDKNSTT